MRSSGSAAVGAAALGHGLAHLGGARAAVPGQHGAPGLVLVVRAVRRREHLDARRVGERDLVPLHELGRPWKAGQGHPLEARPPEVVARFAVSIDNVTQDSSFIQTARGTATHLLLPTSTSTGSFKTTLMVINDSSNTNQIDLKLRDKSGTIQASKSISLAPYGFFHNKNIHGFLGAPQTFGPIEITSVNATPSIIAVARVYSEITTNDGVGTTGSSFTASPYPN